MNFFDVETSTCYFLELIHLMVS